MWEFPKIRGTLLGVPIIRTKVTIVFWGLSWGPLILGNYHVNLFTIGVCDFQGYRITCLTVGPVGGVVNRIARITRRIVFAYACYNTAPEHRV